MNDNINFLRVKFEKVKKESKKDLMINTLSFVFLIIYGVILVSVFIYLSTVNNKAKVLEAKRTTLVNEISSYQTAETKQTYLKSKVNSLKVIIDEQKENQKITEAIFRLIPEGVSINAFTISESGQVSFTVETLRVAALKEFINTLKSTKDFGDLKLQQVDVSSIDFNNNSGYRLRLELFFIFHS